MTLSVIVLLLGAMGGAGVWILLVQHRGRKPLGLAQRVAPWVSDVSLEAHRVAIESHRKTRAASDRLMSRVAGRIPQSWASALDGGERIEVLIAQSGRQITRNRWRLDIVEAAIWGAVTGCVLAILGTVVAHASVWLMLAAVIVGASAGVFLKRYLLARAARQRVVLMLEELPGLCELMAICLTAGEGFREALTRVTDRGSGPLVEELRGALSRFRIGIPVATALAEVSGRLQLAPLSRMVDHVISSIERGSPLAEVLRVQAADARAEAGRRLQERASAREVVMLLPLVFLILPITIAFAIFPGLLVIQTGL